MCTVLLLCLFMSLVWTNQASGSGGGADCLESPEVSLAAFACLQELMLLVAAPAGPARPACEGDERISFDMRVVDGALVRVVPVAATAAPAAAAVTAPASTTAAALPTASSALHAAAAVRASLWADAWAGLSAVCESDALAADDAEAVWPAAAECICAVASAACTFASYSSAASSPGEAAAASSVCESPERFAGLLSLLECMAARRRERRWAACNGRAGKAATAAAAAPDALLLLLLRGDDDALFGSSSSGGGSAGVLAEELSSPKADLSCGSERAVLRGLEGLLDALRAVALARAATPALFEAQRETLRCAWMLSLRAVVDLAATTDEAVAGRVVRATVSDSAADEAGRGGSFLARTSYSSSTVALPEAPTATAPELALPPSALSVQALKLLLQFLGGGSEAAQLTGGAAGGGGRRHHSQPRTVDEAGRTVAAAAPDAAAAAAAARACAFEAEVVSALCLEELPRLAAAQLRQRAVTAAAEAALRPHLERQRRRDDPAAASSSSSSGGRAIPASAATGGGGGVSTLPSLTDVARLAGLGGVAGLAAEALAGSNSSSSGSSRRERDSQAAAHLPLPARASAKLHAHASSRASIGSSSGGGTEGGSGGGFAWASAIVSSVTGGAGSTSETPSSKTGQAQLPLTTALPAAAAAAATASAPVYPIKVWGFGLGGSYGAGGGGGFVAADLPKAARQLGRAEAHAAALLEALTVAVGRVAGWGGSGGGGRDAASGLRQAPPGGWVAAAGTAAAVTHALLEALEAAVGWPGPTVAPRASSESAATSPPLPPLPRLLRLLGDLTDLDDDVAGRVTSACSAAAADDDADTSVDDGAAGGSAAASRRAAAAEADAALDVGACLASDDTLWAAADAAVAAAAGATAGANRTRSLRLQRCFVAGEGHTPPGGKGGLPGPPPPPLLLRVPLPRLLASAEFRAASAAVGWRHPLLLPLLPAESPAPAAAAASEAPAKGGSGAALAVDCVRAEAVLLSAALNGFLLCLAAWDALLKEVEGAAAEPTASATAAHAGPAVHSLQHHTPGAGIATRHRATAGSESGATGTTGMSTAAMAAHPPLTPSRVGGGSSRAAAPSAAPRLDAAAETGSACLGLAARLMPLLMAGAAALAVNPLRHGATHHQHASGGGLGQDTVDVAALALPSPALAQKCRRLRAFGRLCFDALRGLAGIGEPPLPSPAEGASGAAPPVAEEDGGALPPSALVAAHARDLPVVLSRAAAALASHARTEASLATLLRQREDWDGAGGGTAARRRTAAASSPAAGWRHVSATAVLDATVVASALHALLAASALRRGDVPALRGPYDVAVSLAASPEPALRDAAARLLRLLAGAIFEESETG